MSGSTYELASEKPVSIALVPCDRCDKYITEGEKYLLNGQADEALGLFEKAWDALPTFATFEKFPVFSKGFSEEILPRLSIDDWLKNRFLGRIYLSTGLLYRGINSYRLSINDEYSDPLSHYGIALGYFLNQENARFISALSRGKSLDEKACPYEPVIHNNPSCRNNILNIYNTNYGSTVHYNSEEVLRNDSGWGFVAVDPESGTLQQALSLGSNTQKLCALIEAQDDGDIIVITYQGDEVINLPGELEKTLKQNGVGVSRDNYFRIYTLCFTKGGDPATNLEVISQYRPHVVLVKSEESLAESSNLSSLMRNANEYLKRGLYAEGLEQYNNIARTFPDEFVQSFPLENKVFIEKIFPDLSLDINNLVQIGYKLLFRGYIEKAEEIFNRCKRIDSIGQMFTIYMDYPTTIGELGKIGIYLVEMSRGNIENALEGLLQLSREHKDNGLYVKMLGKCFFTFLLNKISEGSARSFKTEEVGALLVGKCNDRIDEYLSENQDQEILFYNALFLLNKGDEKGALKIIERGEAPRFKMIGKIIKFQLSSKKERKRLINDILDIYNNCKTEDIRFLAFNEIIRFYETSNKFKELEEIKDDFGAKRFAYPGTSIGLGKLYVKNGLPYEGANEIFQLVKNNKELNKASMNIIMDFFDDLTSGLEDENSLQLSLVKCRILDIVNDYEEGDPVRCVDELIQGAPDCFNCLKLKEDICTERGLDASGVTSGIITVIPYYEEIKKVRLKEQIQKIDGIKGKELFAFEVETPAIYLASFKNAINTDDFDVKLNLIDYERDVSLGINEPFWFFFLPEDLNAGLNIIEFLSRSDKLNSILSLDSARWDGLYSYDYIGPMEVANSIRSLAVISQHSSANIILNGRDISQNRFGYNIVAIDDKTGEVIESVNFNTFLDESAAAEMVEFLKRQKARTIIAGGIRWDGSKYLTEEALGVFNSLGIKESVINKFSYCHGFITYKGNKDHGLEDLDPERVEILFLNR